MIIYPKRLDQLETQVDVRSKHRRKYIERNEGFMATSTVVNYQTQRKNVQVLSVNWVKLLQFLQKKFKRCSLLNLEEI